MASGYFSLYKNCIPIYSNIYIPFDEVPKTRLQCNFKNIFAFLLYQKDALEICWKYTSI